MKIETGNEFKSDTGTIYTVIGFIGELKVKLEVHPKDGTTHTDILTKKDISKLVKLRYWQKLEA